jgi:hypothetical protein
MMILSDQPGFHDLTPEQREEVQEWVVRRYLQLHTPYHPSTDHPTKHGLDRRRSVRQVFRRRDWPMPWEANDAERSYIKRMNR